MEPVTFETVKPIIDPIIEIAPTALKILVGIIILGFIIIKIRSKIIEKIEKILEFFGIYH